MKRNFKYEISEFNQIRLKRLTKSSRSSQPEKSELFVIFLTKNTPFLL